MQKYIVEINTKARQYGLKSKTECYAV